MGDKIEIKCPLCKKIRKVSHSMIFLIKTDKNTGYCRSCSMLGNKHRYKNGQVYDKKLYQSHIYRIWSNMLSRCNNPSAKGFCRYGGRGITVCKRWNTFKNFFDDMAMTCKDGLTLDRIDNNGNYCKENCRWATKKEQANNTINIVRAQRYTFNKLTLTISEWANKLGINRTTLGMRLQSYGWSVKKALNNNKINI